MPPRHWAAAALKHIAGLAQGKDLKAELIRALGLWLLIPAQHIEKQWSGTIAPSHLTKAKAVQGEIQMVSTTASCAKSFAPWHGCWESSEQHHNPCTQALCWHLVSFGHDAHTIFFFLIFYHGATVKELFNIIINKSSIQLSASLFHFKFTISLLLLWQE